MSSKTSTTKKRNSSVGRRLVGSRYREPEVQMLGLQKTIGNKQLLDMFVDANLRSSRSNEASPSDAKREDRRKLRQAEGEKIYQEFLGLMRESESLFGYGLPNAEGAFVVYDPDYDGIANIAPDPRVKGKITIGERFFTERIIPPEASEDQVKFLETLSDHQLRIFALRHEIAHRHPKNVNFQLGDVSSSRLDSKPEKHATTTGVEWARRVFGGGGDNKDQ